MKYSANQYKAERMGKLSSVKNQAFKTSTKLLYKHTNIS